MVTKFSDRLASSMKERAIDISTFARELGISYQAVKKALEGGQFGIINNVRAAHILGVNSDWLATGKGPRLVEGADGPSGSRLSSRDLTPDEQELLENIREIAADEEQLRELLETIAAKAARMRAMKARWLEEAASRR